MMPDKILAKNFLQVGREYFESHVLPSLKLVQTSRPVIIEAYKIAGRIIHVHYYGSEVAKAYSLAISHNRVEVEEYPNPEMIIYAWDSASPDTDIIAPWDEEKFEKGVAPESKDLYGVYVGGEESLNFYDPKTKIGYFWTYDVARLPDWILGSPFRTILHWFLNDSKIHLIHAAAVGENGKTVLLTAKSGSGKSTTSMSCLLSGMHYLADDYVAVEMFPEGAVAHSLYHSAKVTKNGLGYFPEFKELIWNKNFSDREKAVIFISDIFPEQVVHKTTLDAIFIPKITGKETRIVPATKIEAMLAMAPTTLLQLPMAETKKVNVFKEILGKVPCYILELGPDVRAVPEVIKAFLNNER